MGGASAGEFVCIGGHGGGEDTIGIELLEFVGIVDVGGEGSIVPLVRVVAMTTDRSDVDSTRRLAVARDVGCLRGEGYRIWEFLGLYGVGAELAVADCE